MCRQISQGRNIQGFLQAEVLCVDLTVQQDGLFDEQVAQYELGLEISDIGMDISLYVEVVQCALGAAC